MPIGKIASSNRGKAAIGALLAVSASIGGVWYTKGPDGKQYPTAVVLAVKEIEKWEGFAAVAYVDRIAKPPICTYGYGETKGCKLGKTISKAAAEDLLMTRAFNDFYGPMTKCIKGFDKMPVGVQASAVMGAYNYGVARWCHSTASQLFAKAQYTAGCNAATAFNRAGGKVINGLVKRREMGDGQRKGEAELCLSGVAVGK